MNSEHPETGLHALREVFFVAEHTRRSMSSNRPAGTQPEVRLRKALWRAGIRGFRKNFSGLPGRPDLAFRKSKLAVYVHGCFWHGCPNCGKQTIPKRNSAFWEEKFRSTLARDVGAQAGLGAIGFRVLVIWECELKGDGLEACVQRVRDALAAGPPTPDPVPKS